MTGIPNKNYVVVSDGTLKKKKRNGYRRVIAVIIQSSAGFIRLPAYCRNHHKIQIPLNERNQGRV
jgi:hypothetical protein